MKDDKTVIMKLGQVPSILGRGQLTGGNGLRVNVSGTGLARTKTYYFIKTFHLGRRKDNDIVISENAISRKHLEIRLEKDNWYIHDLNSANGTFMGERPISQEGEVLTFPCTIKFGFSTAVLDIDLSNNHPDNPDIPEVIDDSTQIIPPNINFSDTPSPHSLLEKSIDETDISQNQVLSAEDIQRKFISKSGEGNAGEYTQLVRTAIVEHRQKKTKKYKIWLSTVTLLFVAAIGLIAYQQMIISNAKALALDMFYDMKEMEVSLAEVEYQLDNELQKIKLQEAKAILEIAATNKRKKLQEMQSKYQAYLDKVESTKFKKLNPFKHAKNYEDKLILTVARKFGESELELPKDFSNEIRKYIRYWKSTPRIKRAMRRLETRKYTPIIINALKKQNLPPQFLYLVLQESNFRNKAVGPETRHGIAKGAWQFLPQTGAEFGLKPGPLAKVPEFDAIDERFNFKMASRAGAKYLKHIYSTEAQASGLLVLAGYNYGHNRVKGMIRKMPKNPRERNFWKFIKKYEIPQETYDYVFYIFAAAVIGEDPKYFGFEFNSPIIIN